MNRKNLVTGVSAVLLTASLVGNGVLAYQTHSLNETLLEKEKVISDIGKTVTTLTKENKELENNLINVRQELNTAKASITGLEHDKEKLQSDLSSLKTEVADLRKKTETVMSFMPSRGNVNVAKTIIVEASAYTAYCAGCSGKTTTGVNLRANPGAKIVAVDPNVIPLGTKVYVEGYGYAVAGDTGGAINGYKVDLFMSSKSDAIAWGRRKVTMQILN